MRHSTLAAALALSLGAGAAQAADPFIPETAPAPIADFDWTRFYVGVNVGYGWGDFPNDAAAVASDTLAAALTLTDDLNSAEGVVAGVQAGYNYQVSPLFVVGAEVEFNYSGIDDDVNVASVVPGDADVEWYGTLTARVGITPVPRLLMYAKGGYAFGRAEVDVDGTAVGIGRQSDSNFHNGWTVGGGMEYAVLDNVSVKVEYNYIDLANEGFDLGLARDVDAGFEGSVIKGGINFLF